MKSHIQKFKVWNTEEKRWEKDITMDQMGNFFETFDETLYPTSDNYKMIGKKVDYNSHYIILFSTGFLDYRNLIEIYENDILRHYSAGDIKEDDCYISYTANGYELVHIKSRRRTIVTETILLDYVVVGNVYSNPELLE